MESLVNIAEWYASPSDTFIQMYIAEKPRHVLLNFSMDKLIMKEVSYHILVGLLTRLHRKKKAPWPIIPLWIGLYEIWNLRHENVEIEEIKKYHFDI